ncbi:dihydropteroate synthase [Actinomycetaceae bacterium TAE3-ERU4]|nr:dihydropteroate synthase [Actinomycetaceae bacterium TAE3-ERU4]
MYIPEILQPAPTRVMGILNATPDSFSDGGENYKFEQALSHAHQMINQGAQIIDLGGESTRPGSTRISPELEQERIMPILKPLKDISVIVSVDTLHAATARAAIAGGASIINDVSGGNYDPAMAEVIAETGVSYVCQHWRAEPDRMDEAALYTDVVGQVRDELGKQVEKLISSGVKKEQLILDPGLGFSKNIAQTWEVVANLEPLQELGYPLLIGASRKRFLAPLCPDNSAPKERDLVTAVLSALMAQKNIWAVRVHDVRGSVEAIRTVQEVKLHGREGA